MKTFQDCKFDVELKTGDKTYYISDIGINIVHYPILPAPFPQTQSSCFIIGDFSKLGLDTFTQYECKLFCGGFVVSGSFYYNDITKTIELVGALINESIALTGKDMHEINKRLEKDEYGLYINAENYKICRAKIELGIT